MAQPNEPINSIPDLNNHPSNWYGLTKREYFAALAMQGLLANQNLNYHFERIANDSVDISDALIKALKQ